MHRLEVHRPPWLGTGFSFNHGDNRDLGYLNKTPTFNGNGTHTGTYRTNSQDAGNQSEDYMIVGDDDLFSPTDGAGNDTAASWGIWVKADGYPTGSDTTFVLAKRDYAAGDHEYQLGRPGGASEIYRFLIASGNNIGNRIVVDTTTTFTSSGHDWTHFVVTYDGSATAAGLKIYVNGVDDSGTRSTVGTYSGLSNTATPLIFGGWIDSVTRSLDGDWDGAFMAPGVALSAAQVMQLFQQGRR